MPRALYNCAIAELTAELIGVARSRYGLELRSAAALVGGYDLCAASWRLDTDQGPLVVRVDRSLPARTADWLGAIVARAARAGIPCQAPMPALDGATAVEFRDSTVTIRPFVDGLTLDRDDPAQVEAAGATLGRVHQALGGASGDRPTPSPWAACFWPGDRDPPELLDPQLDAWHEAFLAGARGSLSMGWSTATSGPTTSCGPAAGSRR